MIKLLNLFLSKRILVAVYILKIRMADSSNVEAGSSPQKESIAIPNPLREQCKQSGKAMAKDSSPPDGGPLPAEPVSPGSTKPVVRQPAPAPAKNPWHRHGTEKSSTTSKPKDGSETSSGGERCDFGV